MSENNIYLWTNRPETAYARLQSRDGHWHVEWGYRDPPGSDVYVSQGEHQTSVRDEAVRIMLDHVQLLSTEPGDVEQFRQTITAALAQAATGAPEPHQHR